MQKRQLNLLIREEIEKASTIERDKRAFNLSGRGHELRVTLDRKLAAVLRGSDLPRITISGYGANNYYPRRVFARAAKALERRIGWSPIVLGTDESVSMGD